MSKLSFNGRDAKKSGSLIDSLFGAKDLEIYNPLIAVSRPQILKRMAEIREQQQTEWVNVGGSVRNLSGSRAVMMDAETLLQVDSLRRASRDSRTTNPEQKKVSFPAGSRSI